MGKRIRTRRRGHGSPVYRTPSHRHYGKISFPQSRAPATGEIIDIYQAPGRTSPLMKVKLDTGQKIQLIAVDGILSNQRIQIGDNVPVERGNILPLSSIPDGTLICNIEARPGDGGKFTRSAGSSALVVSHEKNVIIQLPTGQFKEFHPQCRAMVGIVAGGGRKEKPFVKAGKKYHAYRSIAKAYLKVRGIAMNPVNHPFGGGSHQHIGRPSTRSSSSWPGQKVGRLAPKRKKLKVR